MIAHRSHIYGVIGEFEKPEQLVHAATKIREAGYRYYECYTPFPVEGMPEAMAMRRNDVPLITLIGGLLGCAFLRLGCRSADDPGAFLPTSRLEW